MSLKCGGNHLELQLTTDSILYVNSKTIWKAYIKHFFIAYGNFEIKDMSFSST